MVGCTSPRVESRVFDQTSRCKSSPFTLPCCRGALFSTHPHLNAPPASMCFRELNIARRDQNPRTGSSAPSRGSWLRRQRSNVIKAQRHDARDATVDLFLLLHTHLSRPGLRSRFVSPHVHRCCRVVFPQFLPQHCTVTHLIGYRSCKFIRSNQ